MAKRGRKKKKETNLNILVAGLIMSSIVLGVLIYTNSGTIGEFLSPFLGGIMGYVKYILPIGIFAMAIYIAYQEENNWGAKIIQFSIMLLAIAVIMNVYQISKRNIAFEGEEFQNIVKASYDLGTKNIGGGAIGMIIAIPLINLLGNTATIIVSIGIIIGLAVSIFGIDLVNNISAIIDESSQRRANKAKNKKNKEQIETPEKEEKKETQKEKRQREKEEKEQAALDIEQLKINLNDKEEKSREGGFLKFGKGAKKEEKQSPEFIENPLFKEEQLQKEERTKEVLQLEHTVTVEDENYEFPPITLLSEGE